MSKNIVVLTGSPRGAGNTEQLADAFIRGAREAGSNVTVFHASELKVNGCVDCKYCFKHPGACAQKDDMQQIYPALHGANLVVFASPLYFYGMTAQIRAMIDRFFVCVKKPFPVTECVLLLTYGDKGEASAKATIDHYQTFTGYMRWKDRGVVLADGVYDKGEIEGHKSLAVAEALGKSVSAGMVTA